MDIDLKRKEVIDILQHFSSPGRLIKSWKSPAEKVIPTDFIFWLEDIWSAELNEPMLDAFDDLMKQNFKENDWGRFDIDPIRLLEESSWINIMEEAKKVLDHLKAKGW